VVLAHPQRRLGWRGTGGCPVAGGPSGERDVFDANGAICGDFVGRRAVVMRATGLGQRCRRVLQNPVTRSGQLPQPEHVSVMAIHPRGRQSTRYLRALVAMSVEGHDGVCEASAVFSSQSATFDER